MIPRPRHPHDNDAIADLQDELRRAGRILAGLADKIDALDAGDCDTISPRDGWLDHQLTGRRLARSTSRSSRRTSPENEVSMSGKRATRKIHIQIDPTEVYEASIEFDRLLRSLSDLDARRNRVKSNDPPVSPAQILHTMKLSKNEAEWKTDLGINAKLLVSAAVAWDLRNDAKLITNVIEREAWSWHTVSFDVPPSVNRIRLEASKRQLTRVNPAAALDPAALAGFAQNPERPGSQEIVSGPGPADVGPFFPSSASALSLHRESPAAAGKETRKSTAGGRPAINPTADKKFCDTQLASNLTLKEFSATQQSVKFPGQKMKYSEAQAIAARERARKSRSRTN